MPNGLEQAESAGILIEGLSDHEREYLKQAESYVAIRYDDDRGEFERRHFNDFEEMVSSTVSSVLQENNHSGEEGFMFHPFLLCAVGSNGSTDPVCNVFRDGSVRTAKAILKDPCINHQKGVFDGYQDSS